MGEKYSVEQLVRVAGRENNKIRPYLYVDPLQGKHIPVRPSESVKLFRTLAEMVENEYPGERVLVIGFAETATAIGAGIAAYAENVRYCIHTTREKYDDAEYLYFTESHSHAAEQSLIINGFESIIGSTDRIIFAEDEVTTGNTICKLIDVLCRHFRRFRLRFGIVSILNSMTDERISELSAKGIKCLYAAKIPFEYNTDVISKYTYCEPHDKSSQDSADMSVSLSGYMNLRYLTEKHAYVRACQELADRLYEETSSEENGKRILVLGTEEFMFPAMMYAKFLSDRRKCSEVYFHATTRSPIMVSRDEGYPLYSRYKINSMYETGRTTFVYDLSDYDTAVIVTDAGVGKSSGEYELAAALRDAGCKKIITARWTR